jgi:TPR repeat protein
LKLENESGKKAKAVGWYKQAAEMGDRVGQTNLAIALQSGEGLFIWAFGFGLQIQLRTGCSPSPSFF